MGRAKNLSGFEIAQQYFFRVIDNTCDWLFDASDSWNLSPEEKEFD